MGENPFDKCPSPTRGKRKLALEDIQARSLKLTQLCEEKRKQHHAEWEAHKQEHHARRLEQALEHEALDLRYFPTVVREHRDREDDLSYCYLVNFDQLLELTSHEEYLRARRSWDRRQETQEVKDPEDTEDQVKVRPPQTGAQLWSCIVGLFMGAGFFSGIVQGGLVGFLSLPIWVLFWAVFSWLPLIYVGPSNSVRGASGSAV